MTKDLEQTMRNVYNGLPKEELVNLCIEFMRFNSDDPQKWSADYY